MKPNDQQSYEQGYAAAQRQFIDRAELASEILLALAAKKGPVTDEGLLARYATRQADALIQALKDTEAPGEH